MTFDEQYNLVKKAFTQLRRAEYTAKTRTNVSNERMVQDYGGLNKFVVFNMNNYNAAKDEGILRLTWGGLGRDIVKALREQGLTVRWDGRDGSKIQVIFFNFVEVTDLKRDLATLEYKGSVLLAIQQKYEEEIGSHYGDVITYADTSNLIGLFIAQRQALAEEYNKIISRLELLKEIENEETT